MHLQQRGQTHDVAVVVAVLTLGDGRAGRGLDRDDAGVSAVAEDLPDERKRQTGEVGATPGATEHDVGLRLTCSTELVDRLEADDRLVQHDVVEHAPERVAGGGVPDGDLDRLGHCDAEGTGRVRQFREDLRPASVSSEGLGCTVPPYVSMRNRR